MCSCAPGSSLLRGQMAFASGHSADASTLLLADGQRSSSRLDPRLARETYLDALAAAIFVGRLADQAGLPEIAAAARAAPPAPQPPRAPDLLLDGLALPDHRRLPGRNADPRRRAVSAFRRGDVAPEDQIRWSFVACHSAHDLWDDEGWYELSTRYLQLARDARRPRRAAHRAGSAGRPAPARGRVRRGRARWSRRLRPSPRRRATTCPPTAPWPWRAGRAAPPRRPS